jgi:hypothetical protein
MASQCHDPKSRLREKCNKIFGKKRLFNYITLKRFNAFKMLPQQNHPLTLAYLAGARARTNEAIRQVLPVIRQLEQVASEMDREQCKLAAEVLMERSGEWSTR